MAYAACCGRARCFISLARACIYCLHLLWPVFFFLQFPDSAPPFCRSLCLALVEIVYFSLVVCTAWPGCPLVLLLSLPIGVAYDVNNCEHSFHTIRFAFLSDLPSNVDAPRIAPTNFPETHEPSISPERLNTLRTLTRPVHSRHDPNKLLIMFAFNPMHTHTQTEK